MAANFKNYKMDLSPRGIAGMIYLNADALGDDIKYILPMVNGKKGAKNFFEAEIKGTLDLWNQVKDSEEFKKGISKECYKDLKKLMDSKFQECAKTIRENVYESKSKRSTAAKK